MSVFDGRRLVILGCGYLGSAVARAAVMRGARVTALTRNEARAADLRAEGIDTVVGDLADETWHGRIPGAPDFVLNCVSAGGGGVEGYRHSYVRGMASLIAWARRTGPAGTVVYTSSTSVYPQGDGACVDETAPTAGGSERAQLLLEAETALRLADGVWRRWFILRLAGIYGPGRQYLIDGVRSGEVAGNGEHRLNLIHRDDGVAAIMACLAAPAAVGNAVFNVADDGPAPKADVVDWLAGQLGVPVPRFTGEPAGPRRSLTPDRVISNHRLKTQLGWRPEYPTYREGYGAFLSR